MSSLQHVLFYSQINACQQNLTNSTKICLKFGGENCNFIKAGGHSTKQFKEFCKDMNLTHKTLLFHTVVCGSPKKTFQTAFMR